jgi:hypothetical protein
MIPKYHRTECDTMRYNAIETKTEGTGYQLLMVKANPFIPNSLIWNESNLPK